jgi:hypothetical protein
MPTFTCPDCKRELEVVHKEFVLTSIHFTCDELGNSRMLVTVDWSVQTVMHSCMVI